MANDESQYYTAELAKNASKGANYELGGAAIGAAVGAAFASAQKLSGINFFFKALDSALFGWMIGWVGRAWSERSANQHSALQMDARMINLEHENKWLKNEVETLGGHVPGHSDNHAESIKAKRAEGCRCHLKH